MFHISNLGDVIRTEVEVEKEKPSVNLTNFYRHTIDLIQYYLLENKLISQSRSKDLATIFQQMKFLCVDRIQIDYLYEGNVRRSPKSNVITDTYIDVNRGKFYILEKFENSEMRHIDAMVRFLIQDENNQLKLNDHIKKLLKIYQDESLEGVELLRKKCQQTYEPKWIIAGEIQQKIDPKSEEKKSSNQIIVTAEEIEAIKNEASIRPAGKPKEEKPKLESFPATAFKSGESSFRSTLPKRVDTDHNDGSPSNDEQRPHDHESVQTTTKQTDRYESPNDGLPPRHMHFSDSSIIPLTHFENIQISDLDDLDLSQVSVTIDGMKTTTTEDDVITGRQGEQLVYRMLQNEHPLGKVVWVNGEGESGSPYDIYVNLDNGEKEYIEVKTTRVFHQHAFPVSIGEAQFFLKHPENYFIYRVYLHDQIKQSRITKITKVEENLKLKNLKLLLAIISKPSS